MTTSSDLHEALRVPPGTRPDLAGLDPRATPCFDGGKADGRSALSDRAEDLRELQERLYAEARAGTGQRAVLLVLQGMDTSGKGGIVRHVVGEVGAQGATVTGFGVPTEAERGQHYLQRIREALPRPGMIGVFDRSHYEDVVVVRVEELVTPEVWTPRFAEIVDFEAEVAAAGTSVVKVFLHIGHDEQGERLSERLDRPEKHWKYDPADVDARLRWDDYQHAWADAIERTGTDEAPWFVVPADRKWYARWAVAHLLLGTLQELDPSWPTADFDVAHERARLVATSRDD
ncbi:PPK2 family polyphosphate kinase [Aquipuribacter sp. MA13-6]|uniref:PPK2 family polyphosphate kinase n=1 Tax=unclassified Aquipuribacter TaxID=2635084 RepID=UPI003EE99A30